VTDDLVAFLRARLDEDEQTARAAVGCEGEARGWVEMWSGEMEREQAHAERFSPARVLAEVDAKRRILALHGPVILRGGTGAKYYDTTTVCGSCELPQFPEHAFPCPTLRLLALSYREHPDYRPEWTPDV